MSSAVKFVISPRPYENTTASRRRENAQEALDVIMEKLTDQECRELIAIIQIHAEGYHLNRCIDDSMEY